jgi:hypothetical protein
MEAQLHPFFTSTLDDHLHAPASLLPENILSNYWIESWVGMDVSEKRKICGPLPGIEPQIVQLVP